MPTVLKSFCCVVATQADVAKVLYSLVGQGVDGPFTIASVVHGAAEPSLPRPPVAVVVNSH